MYHIQIQTIYGERMRKLLSMILLFPLLLLLPCCGQDADDTNSPEAEGSLQDNAGMTATVTAITDKIEVNVVEGDHGATGIYWVNTSEQTAFLDANGQSITRADIKVGDTVEIRYTGQVMMSYPPQIVAVKITVVG